ncbi:MAG TPA: chemotaxis protein CheW [Ktedonobacterales bacterium]|nr:chemotaxis protein CheW [Ktedonobacterales bacterium]
MEAEQGAMNTSHSDETARAHPSTGEPLNLAELLALARSDAIGQREPAPDDLAQEGDPYLQFTCADTACAAPITHFREVLPTLPTTIALPFSPPWTLGLFALHAELIGLVDPAPLLFETPELVGLSRSRAHNGQVIVPGARKPTHTNWRLTTPESGPTALIIGSGEQMLALAVSAVGDIVYAQPDEIRDDPVIGVPARMPAPRFRAGTLARHDGQSALNIVKIDVLLAELLAALTSVEATPHE